MTLDRFFLKYEGMVKLTIPRKDYLENPSLIRVKVRSNFSFSFKVNVPTTKTGIRILLVAQRETLRRTI